MNNKLYELFEVKNEKELKEFIKNNPDDQRVKELKEFFKYLEDNEK